MNGDDRGEIRDIANDVIIGYMDEYGAWWNANKEELTELLNDFFTCYKQFKKDHEESVRMIQANSVGVMNVFNEFAKCKKSLNRIDRLLKSDMDKLEIVENIIKLMS